MITIERFIRAIFLGFLMANETGIKDIEMCFRAEVDGEMKNYSGRLTQFQDGLGEKIIDETGIRIEMLRNFDAESFIGSFGDIAGRKGLVNIGEGDLILMRVIYGDNSPMRWDYFFDAGKPPYSLETSSDRKRRDY